MSLLIGLLGLVADNGDITFNFADTTEPDGPITKPNYHSVSHGQRRFVVIKRVLDGAVVALDRDPRVLPHFAAAPHAQFGRTGRASRGRGR